MFELLKSFFKKVKTDEIKLRPYVKRFIDILEEETGKILVLVGSEKTDTLKESALASAIMDFASENDKSITTAEAQAIAAAIIANFDKISTAAGEKLEAINQ